MKKYLPYILCIPFFFSSCDKDEDLLPPEITAFSPASGTAGTTVTITGNNFSESTSENKVAFNGAIAEVTSASATSLTVIVPDDATTGKIAVSVRGQVATSLSDFSLIPTLTGFIPLRGTHGSVIAIKGTSFGSTPAENTVLVNGALATVSQATSTQLVVVIPADATTGKISITVDGHTLISEAVFTVEPFPGVSTLAGSEEGYADGVGAAAKFLEIYGMTRDAAGNLYVSEPATNRIRKVTAQGVVTTFAGLAPGGYADGPALEAMFKKPTGMDMDAAGNLYIADYGNHRIRKISSDGMVSTVAGTGTIGHKDGAATEAQFQYPRCVAVDKDGNLYIGETYRIRKITPQGVVSTLAGSTSGGYADGTGSAAKFDSVADLTLDKNGYLYAADYFNNSIRKISLQGEVTTFAGKGPAGYYNGLSVDALFDHPTGVVVNDDGVVFVADTRNYRIRKIIPEGIVNTVAGNGFAGYTNGTGNLASFSRPNALALNTDGKTIVVADNYVIRIITAQQ